VTDEIPIRAPAKVADLTRAGFVRVGEWRLTESGDGLVLDGRAERIAGVYVYTVDGEVRYVGSAQRGLNRRFQRYITSKTMRTSARIRGKIIECLKKDSPCLVEVFTLSPPAFDWGGLPVDLVAGLEEGLIRSMKDLWNIRSHRRS
jgi:hypothetical protein